MTVVHVKVSGQKVKIEVGDDATVKDLKDKIASECKVANEEQRLLFSGQILDQDNKALKDYSIEGDKCTIFMVRNARAAESHPIAAPQENNPSEQSLQDLFGGTLAAGGQPTQEQMIAFLRELPTDPNLQATLERLLGDRGIVDELVRMGPELAANPQLMNMASQHLLSNGGRGLGRRPQFSAISSTQLQTSITNAMSALNINSSQSPSGQITPEIFSQAVDSVLQTMRTRLESGQSPLEGISGGPYPNNAATGTPSSTTPGRQYVTREQLSTALENAMRLLNR